MNQLHSMREEQEVPEEVTAVRDCAAIFDPPLMA